MTRPRCRYKIQFCPKVKYFSPEGIPKKGANCVLITPEEAEALRLKNIKELEQIEAAKKMGVSQSTFQRILSSAHKKMSSALIEGKSIKIVEQKVNK